MKISQAWLMLAVLACMTSAGAGCLDGTPRVRLWPEHQDVWKLKVPDQGYLILQLPDSDRIDWQEQDTDQATQLQAVRDDLAAAVVRRAAISMDPSRLRIYRVVHRGQLRLHFMPYREADKTVAVDDARPLDLLLEIQPMSPADQPHTTEAVKPRPVVHKRHWWSAEPPPVAPAAPLAAQKPCTGKD